MNALSLSVDDQNFLNMWSRLVTEPISVKRAEAPVVREVLQAPCTSGIENDVEAFLEKHKTKKGYRFSPEQVKTFILHHFDSEKAAIFQTNPVLGGYINEAKAVLSQVDAVVRGFFEREEGYEFVPKRQEIVQMAKYIFVHIPVWQYALNIYSERSSFLKITKKVSGLPCGILFGRSGLNPSWEVYMKLSEKVSKGRMKKVMYPSSLFPGKPVVFGVLHKGPQERTESQIGYLRHEGDMHRLAWECPDVVQAKVVKVAKWKPGFNKYAFTYELVAERMKGGSLEDLLRGENRIQLTACQIKDIAYAIACGVHQLHTLPTSIIHEDLKPDNIFLSPNGKGSYIAKIGDLGASREPAKPWPIFTGAPLYWSPQKISNTGDRSGYQDDVWALGLIFYELLHNGARPSKLVQCQEFDKLREVIVSEEGFRGSEPTNNGFLHLIWRMFAKEQIDRPTSSEIMQVIKSLPEGDFSAL